MGKGETLSAYNPIGEHDWDDIGVQIVSMLRAQRAMRASLALLAITSPKLSTFVFARDCVRFSACRRIMYALFKWARRFLAASAFAFIRTMVSGECRLG